MEKEILVKQKLSTRPDHHGGSGEDATILNVNPYDHRRQSVGLWIDHRAAVIVFVSPVGEVTREILSGVEAHPARIEGALSTTSYPARQIPADDRRENSLTGHLNAYYDEIIEAVRDAKAILIFGPGEAKGELKRRIEKDRPSKRIVSVQTVDKMTDRQIAAKVRDYFRSIAEGRLQ